MSLRATAWTPSYKTHRPSCKPSQQRHLVPRRVPVSQRAPWQQQGKHQPARVERVERVESEQQQPVSSVSSASSSSPASSEQQQPASAESSPASIAHSAAVPCKGCLVAASSAVTERDGTPSPDSRAQGAWIGTFCKLV